MDGAAPVGAARAGVAVAGAVPAGAAADAIAAAAMAGAAMATDTDDVATAMAVAAAIALAGPAPIDRLPPTPGAVAAPGTAIPSKKKSPPDPFGGHFFVRQEKPLRRLRAGGGFFVY
ncbi:hypothetical protein CH339_02100 [Rhodobium orientis]|uniref:Uncharacterized protein n=1 Tax=Rhodobium orientis TaxID=34017 RepID=A0A327JUR7_9HYPH|nr:hypothetical protein CH339_02100 [Rhodobium orientis]